MIEKNKNKNPPKSRKASAPQVNEADSGSDESGETSSKSKGSPAKLVRLRNRFFYMLYRYSSLVFLSSLGCLVCSFMFLFIFTRQPVPPQYIPIYEDGRYIKLEPLSVCKDDSEVKKFMLGAIRRIYKYDYINFADQIQDAAQYFTQDGWESYLDEYTKSKTLFAVKENKWIVTVQPNALPVIIKREITDGICTWDMKAEIAVSYIGSSGQSQRGDIFMRIVRNSVINNPDGLGYFQGGVHRNKELNTGSDLKKFENPENLTNMGSGKIKIAK